MVRTMLRAVAGFTLIAIAVQLRHTLQTGASEVNFFSFFTIQSNLIGIAVAFAAYERALARGAATLYLTITGVVFSTLLANGDSLLLPWVNALVHYVMPACILAAWLIDPPPPRASVLTLTAAWLIYPFLYLIYTLLRGPHAQWYPYPFLDPRPAGYAPVALAAVVLAAFAAALGAALAWYARRRRSASERP